MLMLGRHILTIMDHPTFFGPLHSCFLNFSNGDGYKFLKMRIKWFLEKKEGKKFQHKVVCL
jgi:hypothetical protein